MSRVNWRGAAIAAAIEARTMTAIDETTAEAAHIAETDHWWTRRSGNLERQTVTEPAKLEDGRIVGKFGATEVKGFYGLFLERQEPWLQPAADQTFPNLAQRIREG